MALLGHDRYCDEVITQTDLLRGLVKGSDLSVTVPTCPDWSLAELVAHIGGNLRSVETAVRTGTPVTAPDKQVPGLAGPGDDDPELAAEWLIELGQDGFSWRHGHEPATVTLRGPLVDVLRVFYRRLPADSERVEVLGDPGLLDFWLERVSLR